MNRTDLTKKLINRNFQPNRDLNSARTAFRDRDAEACSRAHAPLLTDEGKFVLEGHNENHASSSGDLVKAVVFGGLDGVVTVFAVVAGCVGAQVTPSKVVIVGIGNLVADAFAMGFGEYISSKAELDFIGNETSREEWEVENCPETEKEEMIQIYENKYKIEHNDAVTMINTAYKYPKFFLSHMMVEELGILIDESSSASPLKRGLIMFCSFSCFGMVPLLGFTFWLLLFTNNDSVRQAEVAFLMTFFITLVTLFILGIFKAKMTGQRPMTSGLMMMINGAVASVAAYGSGYILQGLI